MEIAPFMAELVARFHALSFAAVPEAGGLRVALFRASWVAVAIVGQTAATAPRLRLS